MKNFVACVPICVALVLSSISDTQAVDCSLTAVNSRLQDCVSLQFSALLNQQNVQSSISEACKSADCSIGCYTRVYEGCSSTGIFQTIDLKAYKVATRYACQYNQETLDGLQNCGLTSWACFQDLINKIASAVTQHSTSNATAYVSEYCRLVCHGPVRKPHCWFSHEAAQLYSPVHTSFTVYGVYGEKLDSAATAFKACKTSNPLSVSAPCTATQAAVLTNIFDVYLSIEKCGLTHDSSLFTTFGAALEESTCGAGRIRVTFIMAVVVISMALTHI